MNRSRVRFLFLGLCAALGCQEAEGIKEYVAPRDNGANPLFGKKAAPAGPTRILAAIIPRAEATWFVKLMGPAAQLEKQGEAFLELLKSMKFDKPAAPTFAVPAGWARDDSKPGRYSTLRLPADLGPIEATIIQLGPQAGSALDNVNRWRQQIGLPAITDKELPDSTKEVEVAGTKVLLLDATGPGGNAGPMGMMPGAGAPRNGGAGPLKGGASRLVGERAPEKPVEPQGPSIDVPTPAGWKEVPAKTFSVKTFQAADARVEITITPLFGDAGGKSDNINRWRGQVGLEPIDLGKSGTEMQSLETPSGKALVVDFAGKGAAAERITAAIIDQGERTWFIKMKGPAEAAAKEKETFLGLLKTLQLPK